MSPDDLLVPVDLAALLARPGNRRDVVVDFRPPEATISDARVERLQGRLAVEATGEKVTVSGIVEMSWSGACRRCLEPTSGTEALEIHEIYEKRAVEGETYPLPREEVLDLGPMLVEQAILTLPLAPLCSEDCAGPAPESFPTSVESDATESEPREHEGEGEPARDPRWAALDLLDFDEADAGEV